MQSIQSERFRLDVLVKNPTGEWSQPCSLGLSEPSSWCQQRCAHRPERACRALLLIDVTIKNAALFSEGHMPNLRMINSILKRTGGSEDICVPRSWRLPRPQRLWGGKIEDFPNTLEHAAFVCSVCLQDNMQQFTVTEMPVVVHKGWLMELYQKSLQR